MYAAFVKILSPIFSPIFNCLFTFLLLFSIPALAIEIIQSKDNKVLLDLEDEKLSVGQKIFLLNSSGKKIALATVLESKDGRAIAIINKGSTHDAKYVDLISPISNTEVLPEELGTEKPSLAKGLYRLSAVKYSALLNLSMNNMNTKQSDGAQPVSNQEDVSLRGLSIGLTGAIDYPYRDLVILRGTIGYEPYDVTGNSKYLSCSNLSSNVCNASIQYFSTGGYIRFNITKSKYQLWLGIGGTGKFPLSKSTSALRLSDIQYTTTLAVASGIDYFFKNKNFMPISIEYQLFQKSDTVSAGLIMLRGGYGWAF